MRRILVSAAHVRQAIWIADFGLARAERNHPQISQITQMARKRNYHPPMNAENNDER